jgi:osmotically-inducible protein OsmY
LAARLGRGFIISTACEEARMIVSDLVERNAESVARSRPFLDGSVAEKAENRLRANAYLALKNISCEFREGVLTLRGCLPSYYLKQVAQEAVVATEGVERVENYIEVASSAARR